MSLLTRRMETAMKRAWILGLVAVGLVGLVGCQEHATVANPLHVGDRDFEAVWDKTVDAVSGDFLIASEDRRAGKIVSAPLPAGSLLDPWRRDSHSMDERALATVQTMRNKLTVTVLKAEGGGYDVQIHVLRQLEDINVPMAEGQTREPFMAAPAEHGDTRIATTGPPEGGWIDRGRNTACEQYLLRKLQRAFGM